MAKFYHPSPIFELFNDNKVNENSGIVSINVIYKHIVFKFSNHLYASAFAERISFVGIPYITEGDCTIKVF